MRKLKLKPQTARDTAYQRRLSEAYIRRELKTWRPFRLFGVFASFMGLSFTVISICNKNWLVGKGRDMLMCF